MWLQLRQVDNCFVLQMWPSNFHVLGPKEVEGVGHNIIFQELLTLGCRQTSLENLIRTPRSASTRGQRQDSPFHLQQTIHLK
jgi:hypothetical protein